MSVESICALCQRHSALQNSHVVPKFAVRWLVETTATGFLRGYDVNRRAQDGTRVRLLCHGCEQRFASVERTFSERIFLPYLREKQDHFFYEDWLLRFAVSLAWRTLVAGPLLEPDIAPDHRLAVARAVRRWGRFLDGQVATVGPYVHHLLLVDRIDVVGQAPPDGFYSYLLRSIDCTIILGERTIVSYTKLPGMVFASYIIPRRPGGWHGTQIRVSGHLAGQRLENATMAAFIMARRDELFAGRSRGLSERQLAIMRRDLSA